MITRLSLPLLFATAISLIACSNDGDDGDGDRKPYLDEWREELRGPAAQITKLSIGNRLTSDNFANRGNIEVNYVEGTNEIVIEMQRFTIAKSQADADTAFERMKLWAYNIATPAKPKPENAKDACWAEGVSGCYVRNYYEGQRQPVRDGVNFRVTIPRGWDGDLLLTTEDNLEEGIDSYPDRGDVTVDGLAGNLEVNLDSGNVEVRMDPGVAHFARCPANDTCVEMGYPLGCGCTDPTNVKIGNASGQASNITVDVGNPDAWYTMVLENHGTFSSSDDFICTATIDCDAFDDCELSPDFADVEYKERAEVNFPGDPAVNGAGIRISLVSDSCANIVYTEGPKDFEVDDFPTEKRGNLHVCVGCLD